MDPARTRHTIVLGMRHCKLFNALPCQLLLNATMETKSVFAGVSKANGIDAFGRADCSTRDSPWRLRETPRIGAGVAGFQRPTLLPRREAKKGDVHRTFLCQYRCMELNGYWKTCCVSILSAKTSLQLKSRDHLSGPPHHPNWPTRSDCEWTKTAAARFAAHDHCAQIAERV